MKENTHGCRNGAARRDIRTTLTHPALPLQRLSPLVRGRETGTAACRGAALLELLLLLLDWLLVRLLVRLLRLLALLAVVVGVLLLVRLLKFLLLVIVVVASLLLHPTEHLLNRQVGLLLELRHLLTDVFLLKLLLLLERALVITDLLLRELVLLVLPLLLSLDVGRRCGGLHG